MRIISGKLKGKSLEFIKSDYTRPLKDSVKENIFNILNHSKEININIYNSKVFDLYSGIGSFGIECLSRGANKVFFIERNQNIVDILNNNLLKLVLTKKTKVICSKISDFLNEDCNEKFDIFFLDPPFKDYEFLNVLRAIKQKKIYKKNHLVIIHREKKIEDDFSNVLKNIFSRKYGRSKIIFGKFSD